MLILSNGRAFKFENGKFKFLDISSGEGNVIINCFHNYFGSLNTTKTHIKKFTIIFNKLGFVKYFGYFFKI